MKLSNKNIKYIFDYLSVEDNLIWFCREIFDKILKPGLIISYEISKNYSNGEILKISIEFQYYGQTAFGFESKKDSLKPGQHYTNIILSVIDNVIINKLDDKISLLGI